MYLRERCIPSIKQNLITIQQDIKAGNNLGLTDANILAEDFFKVLLNRIYGLSLKNLNRQKSNMVAIDLADDEAGIAFQITSNGSIQKIKDTVEKFYKNNLDKKYNRLKILIIGEIDKKRKIEFNDLKFDITKDTVTISDLVEDIKELNNANEIESIDNWISSELGIRSSINKHPTSRDFDEYFNKFLDEDIDQVKLLLLAQPTLSDCKEVFSDEFFIDVYQYYSFQYQYLVEPGNDINIHSLREKNKFKVVKSAYSDIKSGKHNLPGGISSIYGINALRPGKLEYYTIKFIEEDNDHGISFKIWAFINGRWVFFPKPWRIIENINELRRDSDIKRIIKFLRIIGLNRVISKYEPLSLTSFVFQEVFKKSK